MRARGLVVVGFGVLATAACADLLGIDTYVYVPGTDASADGPVDSGGADGDAGPLPDAAPQPCVPCAAPSAATCGLSCNEDGPTLLAQDTGKIYWITNGGASAAVLRSVGKTSGPAAQKVADVLGPVLGLAQVPGYVVWTTGTAVSAYTMDGGATIPVLTGVTQVRALAGPPPQSLPQPYLFWSISTPDGGVRHCSLPACASGQISQADGQGTPDGLVVGYDVTGGGSPYGFWLNKTEASPTLHGVRLIGGGNVDNYAQNPNLTPVLAVDPSDSTVAYFTSSTAPGTRVTRVGQSDVYSTTGLVRAMAAQGTGVWMAVADLSNPKNGKIVSVISPPGTITEIATGQDSPEAVVVDATYVYWTVRGTAGATGKVMRAGR